MLVAALSLMGFLCLILGQTIASTDTAAVIVEQQTPAMKATLYNTTVNVPINQPANSPVIIVRPELLSRFYLLVPIDAQVSCTSMLDTVPATRFPTVIGGAFTSESSAEPPAAANALHEAKLRFRCVSRLSAFPEIRGTDALNDSSAAASNLESDSQANEPHTAIVLTNALQDDFHPQGPNFTDEFPIGAEVTMVSMGVTRLYLAGAMGIDVNAVTCTPMWEQGPGDEFSLTVSSVSPWYVSNTAKGNVTILCHNHLSDESDFRATNTTSGWRGMQSTVEKT